MFIYQAASTERGLDYTPITELSLSTLHALWDAICNGHIQMAGITGLSEFKDQVEIVISLKEQGLL